MTELSDLASATTIGEAQAVIERFLPRFNARFAVAAQPARAGLAAARPGTRPRGHPRLPAHPQRRARQHRQVATGARCSCCPQRSSAQLRRHRASRCWSAPAANSRSVTRARPSPPGSAPPRSGVLRERRSESWRSTRRWSASPRASAPSGGPAPARRRTRLRPTARSSTPLRPPSCARRPRGRRRAGSRFEQSPTAGTLDADSARAMSASMAASSFATATANSGEPASSSTSAKCSVLPMSRPIHTVVSSGVRTATPSGVSPSFHRKAAGALAVIHLTNQRLARMSPSEVHAPNSAGGNTTWAVRCGRAK